MEHLYISDFGTEHCSADKKTITHPFNHHVLHFVFSGCGYLNGKKVTAGEVFLCRSGDNSKYFPDRSNPWYYGWIGGDGFLFEQLLRDIGFSESCHVCTMHKNLMIEMLIRLGTSTKEQEFRCGLFYAIAGLLIEQKKNSILSAPEQHAGNAVRIIELRSGAVTPLEIAHELNLSRAYLRNIFFDIHRVSLQEYIIQYRMTRASELLISTDMSVSEISSMVGYRDPLMFSKMFKRYRNMSPTAYRKKTKVFTDTLANAEKNDPRYRGEPIEQLYNLIIDNK